MRTLDELRILWAAFKTHTSLDELKGSVRIVENGDPAGVQLRSVFWKALLLFEDCDHDSWQSTLTSSRTAYELLRTRFTTPKNAHDGLVKEIEQDVVRCMPNMPFFQSSSTQKMLTSILLVYCRLNPDLSYRQGMHELAAPIIWVVENDAMDPQQNSKLLGEDITISTLCNAEYIEHDAFALFSSIMHNAKKFYEQTSHTAAENPLVSRSQRIAPTLLSQIDPDLAAHLTKLEIPAQIFLIRWIRLLFSREFEFNDVLTVWDVIFAEDASLEIVDYVCLVMLLRIRWELVDSSYNEALTLLLHYPPLDQDLSAQTMVIDALALRDNLAISTGNRLVVKYTGRPMLDMLKPGTPPAVQRNITAFSGIDTFRRSLRSRQESRRRGDIQNNLLQSTRSMLDSGGQVVRNAIEGVQRRVEEQMDKLDDALREREEREREEHHRAWSQRQSRADSAMSMRMRALENRNSDLAALLNSHVEQLWKVQEQLEQYWRPSSDDQLHHMNKLILSVAQVQQVQTYLQDSTLSMPGVEKIEPLDDYGTDEPTANALPADSDKLQKSMITQRAASTPSNDRPEQNNLPVQAILSDARSALPEHDNTLSRTSTSAVSNEAAQRILPVQSPAVSRNVESKQGSIEGLLDPSAFEETEEHILEKEDSDSINPQTVKLGQKLKVSNRPALSESAYSWMLGQPKDDTFGVPRIEKAVSDGRPQKLFDSTTTDELIEMPKTRRGIRPKKKIAVPTVSTGDLTFETEA